MSVLLARKRLANSSETHPGENQFFGMIANLELVHGEISHKDPEPF